MTTHREKTRLYVSGSAVQQLSNYVAVSKTKSADECLRELILNTLLTFENESSTDITTVQKLLNDYFGIDCQRHQVESAVNYLLVNQYIMENDDHNLTLRENTREKINDRIQSSINLQNNVKDYWILQLNSNGIMLDSNKLWSSLQDYLAKAFLRHGIQVVSYLDSNYIIPDEYKNSLSMLLHESVKPYFSSDEFDLACRLNSDFMA